MAKKWWERTRSAKKDGLDRRTASALPLHSFGEADFDPSTGTLKWDRFTAITESQATGTAGVLLLIDLTDHTRRIVEEGPGIADDLLPLLGQAIRQAVRSDDLVAREHGFRFAVLLRGASEEVSRDVCDRILASVEDTIVFSSHGLIDVHVAVSGSRFDEIGQDTLRLAQEKLVAAVTSTRSIVAL